MKPIVSIATSGPANQERQSTINTICFLDFDARAEIDLDGTLLQDLRTRTAERTVFEKGPQKPRLQAMQRQAKERASGYRGRRQDLRVHAAVTHFSKERDSPRKNGQFRKSQNSQSRSSRCESRKG